MGLKLKMQSHIEGEVPVRISVSVPMIVATRTLGRGEIVSASDVTTSMIELHRDAALYQCLVHYD